MSTLRIPFIGKMNQVSGKEISTKIKQSGISIAISQINWPEFPYAPKVQLSLGYCNERLWLNYFVKNDYMRTVAFMDQEPVWEDSCVEFFVKCGEDYRNFEFNALGVCVSAIGPNRSSRTRLSKAELDKILRFPLFTKENLPAEGELCDWEFTVAIPLAMLGLKPGNSFMGNFYKCGDKTAIPHYLSWLPINSPKPNFHLPEFFGEMELAD